MTEEEEAKQDEAEHERFNISARGIFCATLSEALRDILAKAVEVGDVPPETRDAMAGWLENANPEALVAWLDKGGLENVNKAELDAELAKAFELVPTSTNYPAPESWVDMEGIWHLERGTMFAMRTRREELRTRRAKLDPPEELETRRKELKDIVGRLQTKRAELNDLRENYDELLKPDPAPMVVRLIAKGWWLSLMRGLRTTDDRKAVLWPDGKPARWLRLLAAPWLQDAAEKEAERQQRAAVAAPFAIRAKAKTDAGNQWTPLPRALEGAAAMGGPFSVNLNGEIYAEEPDIAAPAVGHALRPKGWDIVPADWLKKPAQLDLSLNLTAPPDAVREYLIETATKTAHLAQLPNMCPKLLGFMFAASPVSGRPVKGTLEELHRLLYPDWKARRQTKRELQGLGAAFVALKGLRLMETKPDGTRHPYDLFTLDYDLSCNPQATVGFVLNPWLVERMQGGAGGGYFLLNMTRWLALGIQNPRLFPLALRLAAQWDHARQGGVYHKEKLQWLEADRLAFECNTLPEGAAAFRAGKTADRTAQAALAAARANLEADLGALKEAGLLGDWKKAKVHGKGFNLLPTPPADYPEACKRATQAVQKGKARKGKR